VKRAVIPDVT